MGIQTLILYFLIAIAFSLPTFSQSVAKKAPSATKAKPGGCLSGEFSFKCPEGYKVILTGKADDRLFFAKNSEFGYGVFVVFEPGATSFTDAVAKIVEQFVPKGSQHFEWKEVEADPRKSSRFEIESKRRVGINQPTTAYLVFEYRQVELNGKKLLTGSVVNDFEEPDEARSWFRKGTYSVNGACFDAVDIIAAFTKEKLDPESGPCAFEIIVTTDKQ